MGNALGQIVRGLPLREGRSSGFSPLSLAPALWLKADAGAYTDAGKTTLATDTDPVRVWADQSGNGRDVTQATSAARPVWRSGIQNGLPVVRFDGVDDCLTRAASGLPITTAPRSLFAAFKLSSYGFMVGWKAGADYSFGLNSNGLLRAYISAYYQAVASPVLTGTFYVGGAAYNGTSVSIFRNGVPDSGNPQAVTTPTASPEGIITVGGLEPATVTALDLAELLIFPGDVSAAQALQLQTYLNRWGAY